MGVDAPDGPVAHDDGSVQEEAASVLEEGVSIQHMDGTIQLVSGKVHHQDGPGGHDWASSLNPERVLGPIPHSSRACLILGDGENMRVDKRRMLRRCKA